MAQYGLHWMERKPDPNVFGAGPIFRHINQPRISAATIVKLIKLKNKLLGSKTSIYEESQMNELQPFNS